MTYHLLARLIGEGQVRGEIRRDVQPEQLAEILTGIYTLTLLNWVVGWWNDTEPLDLRLLRTGEIFLQGCRPAGTGAG